MAHFNPDSGEYEESDIPLPEGGGGGYRIGHGLLLDRETNTLSVNAVSDFEGDNTFPLYCGGGAGYCWKYRDPFGTIW